MVSAVNSYDLGDERLNADIAAGLADVEVRLAEAVKSDDDFISAAAKHLVDAGGKRFRPLLAVLAANLGDPGAPGVTDSAVVVELTHLATLYHDDVMDALLVGEAQTSQREVGKYRRDLDRRLPFRAGLGHAGHLGPEAVRIQARTFERLVTGQIHETVGPVPGEDPVEHHLQVLADKTGSLIATSGRFGAMFAGCDDATIEVMTRYGERIGVAFQLADDLVDVASDGDTSGKTQGTDLREGIQTLPALIAMRSTDPADARLQDLLSRPLPDDAEHIEAIELLAQHPAFEEARAVARSWADDARESISVLDEGPVRGALEALCDYVVTRTG